jgi:hypothetical protein
LFLDNVKEKYDTGEKVKGTSAKDKKKVKEEESRKEVVASGLRRVI